MHILFVSRGYPTKQEPTWGCFEKDQAESLAHLGHKVTVISVDIRFRWHWRKLGITQQHINGVSVYNLFCIPYALLFFLPTHWKHRFYAFLYKKLCKRVIQAEGQPDVIYAHYLNYMYYGIQLQKELDVPLVGIEHWSEMGKKDIQASTIQHAQQIYSQLDQLIVVSSALRDNILNHIPINTPIQVVNNMVGQEFNYVASDRSTPLTIVSTGRLIPLKGYDLLIEALSRITDMPKGWQLLIIGDGIHKHEIEKSIIEKGLQDHIKLIGRKSKNQIAEIYHDSDFFVLPSRSETFGVVYIEALACGLPVIATDCGGPTDIITSKNGLMVPSEDIEGLATAIRQMVEHLNNYDRKAIAEDCEARFAPNVIAQRLAEIFCQTIKTYKKQ
jgi:glycosyltransferase involved in cell wall biosynthesis